MNHFNIAVFFVIAFKVDAQEFIPTTNKGYLVHHDFYTMSYVEEYEQAEWTFHLICKKCYGSAVRKNNFREDPKISTISAQIADYAGSGYDRGHLVPAGDMSRNEIAMSESFFMSNMSPQIPAFNRGIWQKLEGQLRSWSFEFDTMYVVTGPIINFGYKTIGKNQVAVPQFYFKAIFLKNSEIMIGFILPNQESNAALYNYQVTIDQIEKITNLDIFASLDDRIERIMESRLVSLDFD